MEYNSIKKILTENKQTHVLQFWDSITRDQREQLSTQIKSIDFRLLNRLFSIVNSNNNQTEKLMLKPVEVISLEERAKYDSEMLLIGEKQIKEGKVAAFLVAGGQGSRLGFDGPKGIFPITPVKKKTLFQLHAEKILAANHLYNTLIPWYIMTSMGNHNETVYFFKKNNFFGLKEKDVTFFKQEMIASLDKSGKLLLESKEKIFMNPNGHGGSLKAIWDSGAYLDMKNRGIETIFYFQVDNVLTQICDPTFIGYHLSQKSEMSSKVVRKAYPEEKLGVICSINGKTGVVEYSDLSEKDMFAMDVHGRLKYWAGSIAIHLIELNFVEKMNKEGFKLPYHFAEKNIPYINSTGTLAEKSRKNGYKFETFVFDALQYCNKIVTIEVERADEFSALKNITGVDSKETAISDLSRMYIKWLKAAGVSIPDLKTIPNIEISPLFAHTKSEVIKKKKQLPKFINNLYIES